MSRPCYALWEWQGRASFGGGRVSSKRFSFKRLFLVGWLEIKIFIGGELTNKRTKVVIAGTIYKPEDSPQKKPNHA
jgi:hypothetical protein